MLIIPAIDIMQGKCVRLVKGNPLRSKIYSNNPIEMANRWVAEGAEILHIIDLDAALGNGSNLNEIKTLIECVPTKVQVGGGIHTAERADKLLNFGSYRIIFGTYFVKNPELVEDVIQRYGANRVAVALDVKQGKVMVDGWKNSSEIDYLDIARAAETMKVGSIICTSVEMDGTLQGPAFGDIEQLVENVNIPVIASGGVSTISDLLKLAQSGVIGTIVGAALYEEKFTLKEAIEELKNAS